MVNLSDDHIDDRAHDYHVVVHCCNRLSVGMILKLIRTKSKNDRYKDHLDGQSTNQVVDLPDEKLQALHKEAKALCDSYIKVG